MVIDAPLVILLVVKVVINRILVVEILVFYVGARGHFHVPLARARVDKEAVGPSRPW